MIQTYLTGIAALVAISLIWLAIQRLWRHHFPEHSEADAMANRSGCQNCTCIQGRCESDELNLPSREAP